MNIFSSKENLTGKRIHFVGIKGTGCAAFCEILKQTGAIITGSDVDEVFYTDKVLEKINVKPSLFSAQNITREIDTVIHSSAYTDENCEIARAKELGIPLLLYTEALGLYSRLYTGVGISGVHGKTSTTSFIGALLKSLPLKAQVLSGSLIKGFSQNGEDSCTFTSPAFTEGNEEKFFVAETCEYKRHFMSFSPKIIILTSVESDHQDFYPTLESIRSAFIDYACLLPKGGILLYSADDEGALFVARETRKRRSDISFIPYGEKAEGDFHVTIHEAKNGYNRFFMDEIGEVKLKMPGRHMARNAACALTLASLLMKKCNLSIKSYESAVKTSLENFSGLKRRSEVINSFSFRHSSLVIMDDYAHHPTAIKTTLQGLRDFYKDYVIIADFMSHTYSRTLALFTEFAESFDFADVLILNKIYASAREKHADCEDVAKRLFLLTKQTREKKTFFFPEPLDSFETAKNEIEENLRASRNVLFITLGAGDNWKLSYKIAEFFSSQDLAKR